MVDTGGVSTVPRPSVRPATSPPCETTATPVGIAWWSPDTSLVSVAGGVVELSSSLPQVHVVGPYAVIERGRQDADTATTVVDTRSGAVTYLNDNVTDADGGTIALTLGPNPTGETLPGVLRVDSLEPLSCS